MESEPNDGLSECSDAAVTASMLAGLRQLVEAAGYARAVECSGWDFAVEIESLRKAGLTNGDLRWLVCKGYVEHAVDMTPPGNGTRTFETEGRLSFSQGSCFVLTESGAEFHRELGRRAEAGQEREAVPARGDGAVQRAGPHWDPECRVLRVDGKVVKQFRVPAGNQELLLTALEEMGWPSHMDDPLPPVGDVDPTQRLRDTIRRLNRRQPNRLIRFHGDGSGRGVWWELLG